MNEILQNARPAIDALCHKHCVKSLYGSDSVLSPRFTDRSDADFPVDFNGDGIHDYLAIFFELKYALQDLVGRDVDLVKDKAIRNPIFTRNVERTRVKLYG